MQDVRDEKRTAAEKLRSVFQDDGIRLAMLFGSAVTSRTPRDVDVSVLFDSYHFDHYLTLRESLCQMLGTQQVDLVVLNRANAALKLSALVDGELLYARAPTELEGAIAQAVFEYEDYLRFKAEYKIQFERRSQDWWISTSSPGKCNTI
jgi:predicted nucleotidyltransferase